MTLQWTPGFEGLAQFNLFRTNDLLCFNASQYLESIEIKELWVRGWYPIYYCCLLSISRKKKNFSPCFMWRLEMISIFS